MDHRCHHLCGKSRGLGQTEGHADALVLLALPHEPHVPAVGMADQEVHVEVAQIHLGDQVVEANELLNSMQPLHFEMFVPNAAVGLAEIYTASLSAQGRTSIRVCRRSPVVAPPPSIFLDNAAELRSKPVVLCCRLGTWM